MSRGDDPTAVWSILPREWAAGAIAVALFAVALVWLAGNDREVRLQEELQRAKDTAGIWRDCRAPRPGERLVVTTERASGPSTEFNCAYHTGGYLLATKVREVRRTRSGT